MKDYVELACVMLCVFILIALECFEKVVFGKETPND